MKKILGLDMGVASIGWSLIEYNQDDGGNIIDSGVRIFDQNLQRDNEAQKGESKNQQRTLHRGMRRQRDRKRRRKRGLYYSLKDVRMCPVKSENEEWNKWIDLNPYELRTKGLDEQLSLMEFGRVLYHLNQRRGFKSNRKVGKDKEDGAVATEISKIRAEMKKKGMRTLGEYLFSLQENHFNPPVSPDHDDYEFKKRIRNKYTDRNMYEEEFELLWEKQTQFYPQILSEKFKAKLSDDTIFFQRPLKSQKHLIGKCSLESDKKKIPKGHLLFQKFRIAKTLNNLELMGEYGQNLDMSDEHKRIIREKLERSEHVSFSQLKKALGLNSNAKFNLETSDDSKLKGDTTSKKLSSKNAFGKEWYGLDEEFKNHVVDVLIHVEKPDVVEDLALNKWGRTKEQANHLKMLQLEKGYGNFSYKAIRKIMPLIKQGKRENEAIKEVYGEVKKLPKEDVFELPLLNPNDYRNPVVFGAMVELRKVVNAILRKYGLPDIIRVELARDLKNSKKLRDEITKKNNKLEKRNKEAIKALKQSPFNYQNPSRTDIIKYNLWIECNKTCPYTGRVINGEALDSGEFEIEHILPFSRTLDDSYANKTLCESDFNRRKGNRTPYECIEAGLLREEELEQRIKNNLPWRKRRKFTQKTIDTDEFIARQLNDTRYMSREASKYLKQLGSEEWPVDIQVTKGQTTSLLRHLWGLNSILSIENDEIKNRDDHRHHAVDAIVIALTSRSILKKLSDENKLIETENWMDEEESSVDRNRQIKDRASKRITNTPPWDTFWQDSQESVNQIIVSHKVSRKISGAFHEETYYGPTEESTSKKDYIKYLVVRKKVESLSEKELGWNSKTQTFDKEGKVFIRDEHIKKIVRDKIWEKYKKIGDIKKAIAALETDPPKLFHKNGKDFNPIHKVRLLMEKDLSKMNEFEDEPKTPTRYALYGNNHHIAIYEYTDKNGNKKQTGEVIPTMEAARRVLDKEPIIMREHPEYDRFLFSLSTNEMVQDAEDNIFRVQKISSDTQMTFRLNNIALKGASDPGVLRKNPSSVASLKKVRIDPIGQIFPAND
ncbi:type II CRISPR RNA-guided endonuclease Cas9 [bacterium]|nr:type II CRISPR RNA-guided endonuclease Cas9 [bacterium]